MDASATTTLDSPVILIVEDHRAVRQALRELVHVWFDMAEVLEATSVGEALRSVDARKVDIVLMDIRLPDVDGLTGARRLLARAPGAAVLIVSNLDDRFHRHAARDAGAKGFLSKRSLATELVPAIEALLAPGSRRMPAAAKMPDEQGAQRHDAGPGLGAARDAPLAGTA